jgi:aminoglycoside phosphotransferase family enzyme/gluconate kinase
MKFDISNMLNPAVYDHPVKAVELIETHISWVLLTGDFAYKIKKPVDFGFLDFSTLEKRRNYCDQEIYLNKRLAPGIYIEVVSISKSQDSLVISKDDEALEYAVKMQQFPQSCQLDNMLEAGKLDVDHMDAIAHMIAKFHQVIEVADDAVSYGNKDLIYQPVEENFTQIEVHIDTGPYKDSLSVLNKFSTSEFKRLESVFGQRKYAGFIRECHGDMHLRNMVWLDNGPAAFDCIEFNENLRWIDVLSEVSFLVMDLQDRKHDELANRFLNKYLEVTGDYEGLAVLKFYLCYRALVRAKVDALRIEQKNISDDEREKSLKEFETYLDLAVTYTQKSIPKLIIMRGMSASGKSTVSQKLVDMLGLIRIRSDTERKRLFGIDPEERASGEIESGIYSREYSEKTYKKLRQYTAVVLDAGYSVIVDAAFLKSYQCVEFYELAENLKVSFIILEITAPIEVLRNRISERVRGVSDATIDVLNYQYTNWQSLDGNEPVITVDTSVPVDYDGLVQTIMDK